MCQPRRLGGRRCPVHQHQNIAVIKTAGELSGLNRTQTERLFAELRREGRNSRRLSAAQRERSWNSIREAAANTSVAEAVTTELQRATEHDRDLDGASGYAQRLLITRAKERGEALDNRFQEIADRTGYSKTEVKELFNQYADEVDTSRGSTTQSEYYNQNTRNAAVRANLPYDRASVIALGRLNDLAAPETERRVRLIDAPSGSHIKAFGYDEGRLEVQFHSNPDQVYAYQNVPEGLWEHLSTAQRPGSVYARQIRGNSDYMYPSAVEAEQDAYRVRCASCGQFRASIHTCPERETRATLAEAGLTGQEIATVMAEEAANNPAPEVLEEAPADAAAEVDAPVTETPDEEEEPAAEATSTRRTRQPRTPREPAQPVIVTPAPDYEVPTQEVVELTPDSEETIRDSHDILNREGTTFPSITEKPVTVSSQLSPEAYDPDTLLVSKLTNFQFITVAQDTSYFSTYDSTIRADLGEAVLQEIDNSDSHTRFVIARENAESPFKVLYTYDDRVYTTKTEYEYGTVGYTRSVVTRRRGKTDVVKTYTAEEHAALVEAENQKLGALVDAGTAVKIEGNSSETKKYRFDGNLKTQPHMKTGQAAAFKRAIKENKVVIMPVNVRLSDGMDKVVDDQGFSVSARHNTEISGEVAIRRNAEGVMEVISSSRKLKCYCADYRAKYDCQHVRYVQRHIANVAQQMNPVAATRAAGTHPLMTAPLLTRGDVQVVEPENGEPYISFGTSLDNVSNAPHNYSYQLQQRLTIPPSLQPADDGHPTTEEVGRMLDYYNMVSSVNSFSTVRGSTDIRRALRRSDVEVPLAATFRGANAATGRYETNHVTGSITYEKTDSTSYENLGIRSNTLKCSCDEYRRNYDCPHVRFVKDQSMAVLYVNQRASSVYAEENSYNNFSNRYRTEINNEQQVRNLMTNGRSREEAERLQANEAERLRVEAEERRERQARADAERNAAMAARLQAEAEALRSRNQPVIDATTQYRERMVQRWATQDATYESNPAAFFDDYKAALKRKKDGEHAIPFRTENVTDGICADEPGARQFGIELEFDIKNGVDKRTALRKIGQELHEAGLTPHANQTHYHSAAANGYAMWSFENDCTVDAELVSPLMKDTPEHWEQLRKACEIIERNGGIATTRAGSHVHVSTASYELSTAKHAELLRTVNNNDDIMYRLASNPTRGKHRGTRWCAPNVNDPQGDIDEDVLQSHRVLGSHSSHGYALNFEGTGGTDYKKNNVEFRMWDSTLDPAVIQQQVAVSAAITDYAERSVIENKGSKKGATPRDNIGNGHRAETAVLERAGTKTHTAESFVEANAKVATFFDKLFRRKEDRAAATALFAATTWQRS